MTLFNRYFSLGSRFFFSCSIKIAYSLIKNAFPSSTKQPIYLSSYLSISYQVTQLD